MEYKKDEITIIIPCYKAARYMDDLYNSLNRQTFKNFKVLLVNDGDKEQSKALNTLAERDSRFKVIWKENGGASSARNVGIDLVDTEWMMFVDADDKIKDCYLENMFNSVAGTNAEIGIGGYTSFWEYNNTNVEFFADTDGIEKSVPWGEAFKKLSKYSILCYPWNKIYKTEIVHKHKLYQDQNIRVTQDYVFNLYYFKLVHYVGVVRDSGYIYRREDGFSLVSCFDNGFEKDRLLVYSLEEKLYQSLGKSKEEIDEIMDYRRVLFAYMQVCNLLKKRCPLSFSEKVARVRKYVYDTELYLLVKNYPKHKLSGFFIKYKWLMSNFPPSILVAAFTFMSFVRTVTKKKYCAHLFYDA